MVTEVLFRGKRVDNRGWVYGYYCPVCFGRFPCRPAIVPEPNGEWRPIEIKENSLCEYTTLTDNNGTKIFNGDIIHIQHEDTLFGEFGEQFLMEYDAVVMFVDGCYITSGICNGQVIVNTLSVYSSDEVEVIGNIIDNPEFLN